MIVYLMNPAVILALATLLSAVAKLVWSFRRRR
jgi:hypothetical protein